MAYPVRRQGLRDEWDAPYRRAYGRRQVRPFDAGTALPVLPFTLGGIFLPQRVSFYFRSRRSNTSMAKPRTAPV